MKQKKSWFEIYPDNRQATNLSIAGGAARLLAILLAIPGALLALGLLAAACHALLRAGPGWAVLYLLDEMDEELAETFFLLAASAVCFYGAHALHSKARMLGEAARRDAAEFR